MKKEINILSVPLDSVQHMYTPEWHWQELVADLDTNSDGNVDLAEWRGQVGINTPLMMKNTIQRMGMLDLFARMGGPFMEFDLDGDLILTEEEFRTRYQQEFNLINQNTKMDYITLKEWVLAGRASMGFEMLDKNNNFMVSRKEFLGPNWASVSEVPVNFQYNVVQSLGVFEPSDNKIIKRMLAMLDLQPGQTLIDIGSGDGRVLCQAARKYKTKGIGIEINPDNVKLARKKIKKQKLGHLVEIREMDAFAVEDYSKADAIFTFVQDDALLTLTKLFDKQLKPGTKVISHGYQIPGWIVQNHDLTGLAQAVRKDWRDAIFLYEFGKH